MGWAVPQKRRFHEPLLRIFLLLTCSFMFSGTPRISSFLTPDATPAANVPTDVFGDGPGDSDGDDAADAAEADNSDASLASAWSLPPDMAEVFMSQAGLGADTWEESKRLGPSAAPVVCWWAATDSSFRALQRDPCMVALFLIFLNLQ